MKRQTTTASSPVAIVRCSSYNREEVTAAVNRGINLLGGPASFVQPNEKILFKPNVLLGTDPAKCVVTHPEVLHAAVSAFASSHAHLFYGDSPAALQKSEHAIKKCGYPTILSDLPVQFLPFNNSRLIHVPHGKAGKQLQIVTAVDDADGIINCPKLKTHALTRMTGAIKNLYGCIPPLSKGHYHARFPNVYDFATLLADIAAYITPRLHIMDAIEAMEGNGPQSGTPKKMNTILLSPDPVALDTIACRLIGLDPTCVPTIAAAEKAGLGYASPEHITLLGDDITPLITTSFLVTRKPPVSLPQNRLLGMVKHLFLPQPAINKALCTRCGRCIEICPLSPPALSRPSPQHIPRYSYSSCIRCYCCQELCPSKAITIRYPLLSRLLPFASYLSLIITRKRFRKHAA